MINTQNEIRYRIAWGMLKEIYKKGHLTIEQYDIAHNVLIDRYGPMTVCRFG